jgi:hypothetical protein
MAKKEAKPEGARKALLLVDCRAGKCQQVVELDAAEIAALVADGVADDNPAAVAAYE